jgi:hypothetical protein
MPSRSLPLLYDRLGSTVEGFPQCRRERGLGRQQKLLLAYRTFGASHLNILGRYRPALRAPRFCPQGFLARVTWQRWQQRILLPSYGEASRRVVGEG